MWAKIKAWFKDSETIFWARLQFVAGVTWTVLSGVDLAPLLSPQTLTYWLIASGIITEVVRRYRAEDM